MHRLLAILCLVVTASAVAAGEPSPTSAGPTGIQRLASSIGFHPTLKLTALPAHNPADPLYPDRNSLELLARLRLDLDWQPSDAVDAKLAYEQRARWTSMPAASAGLIPGEAVAPYRLRQLDRPIAEDDDSLWAHELDRAYVAWNPDWGQLTLGRQAIGMGRGVLFSAVDLFAPFTPLEIDREWRRGVDAARLEYRLDATTSAELIGAFGESVDESAFLGRLRGYLGLADAELLAGRRARDVFLGAVLSGAVMDAELHAETAFFDTPDEGEVLKAVAGGSYTFDVGDGLTVLAEYHYSGFGAAGSEEAQRRLAFDRDFQTRYQRGDTQILGRQALGLQLTYPLSPTWNASLTTLGSPVDGSGVAMPGLRWDATASLTLTGTLFVPWGDRPDNGRLTSEYGATPLSLFLQASLYF